MPTFVAVKSLALVAALATTIALTPSTTSAAEAPLPRQLDRALDCAALGYVATASADPDSPQGNILTKRSYAFRMVYGLLLEDHTRRTSTNGDISSAVNGRALLLNTLWTADRNEVLQTHRLCTNWIAGVGHKVIEITGSNPSMNQVDAYRQVIKIPINQIQHRFPEKSLQASDQIVTLGFEGWRAGGLVTSDSVLKSLNRSSVTKP